jgi:hypothetical protein
LANQPAKQSLSRPPAHPEHVPLRAVSNTPRTERGKPPRCTRLRRSDSGSSSTIPSAARLQRHPLPLRQLRASTVSTIGAVSARHANALQQFIDLFFIARSSRRHVCAAAPYPIGRPSQTPRTPLCAAEPLSQEPMRTANFTWSPRRAPKSRSTARLLRDWSPTVVRGSVPKATSACLDAMKPSKAHVPPTLPAHSNPPPPASVPALPITALAEQTQARTKVTKK